jgi:hypothetical protein
MKFPPYARRVMVRVTNAKETPSACSRQRAQRRTGEAGHNLGGVATAAETFGKALRRSAHELHVLVLTQLRLKRLGVVWTSTLWPQIASFVQADSSSQRTAQPVVFVY